MRILCIIIIYNQDFFKTVVYNSFIKPNLSSLDKILIYDNSLVKPSILSQRIDSKMQYVWNQGQNLGLSACFNKAARIARTEGFEWLLLLDQDTYFPPQSLYIYKENIKSNRDIKIFAPIHRVKDKLLYMSPVNSLIGLTKVKPLEGICSITNLTPINSGLLIDTNLFFEVGGYNDSVRVDFSDIQFISRVRGHVSKFYVLDIECIQDFSYIESDIHKLFIRFKLFHEGYKNYKYTSMKDFLDINYLFLKRLISLTIKTKKLCFIKYCMRNE